MSTPKAKASGKGASAGNAKQPPAAKPRPKPKPVVHNGQPANGKHVPSAAPGSGPFDYSGAVGSNVTSVPGPDRESPEVLGAAPWEAAYPTPGLEQAPMY